MERPLQRVPLAGGPGDEFLRPVRTHDHDAMLTACKPPAKVKEQSNRGPVGPMDVIQDDEERLLICERTQHVGDLTEEESLVHGNAAVLRLTRQGPDAPQPVIAAGHRAGGPRKQALAGQDGPDKRRSPRHQCR